MAVKNLSKNIVISRNSIYRLNIKTILIMLSFMLFASITIGVSIGPVPTTLKEVWRIAFYKMGLANNGVWDQGLENIVWLIRFPRVLLAAVVGAGLAVVGVTLQAIVRNPLADSYILGISSGASVGAVLAIGAGFSILGNLDVQAGGFLGALIAFVFVYMIANNKGVILPGRLILAGIGIGYVFSGITSFITLTSSNRGLAGQILSWTMGSLARASWFDLTFPTLILVTISMYLVLQSRNLNAISLGDETAVALGVDIEKFRKTLFVLTSLLTGLLVAVSGAIGFVGLIIPHVVRIFFGSDHRKVLPISFLVGSIFLIWVDVFARTLFEPKELPVGVITSMLGGPLFILLLIRSGKYIKGRF